MGWAKAWVRGVGRSVGTTVTVTLTGIVNDVLGCHLSLQGPGAPRPDAPPVAMAAPPLPRGSRGGEGPSGGAKPGHLGRRRNYFARYEGRREQRGWQQ